LEFYGANVPGAKVQLQRRAMAVADGWLQFRTAEEPDSLRGESIDFAVVDEAAHIPKMREIWELCLRPCLMDRMGDAWFISTPKGFNYFSELYDRGRHGEKDWASFRYSSDKNPYLNRAELEDITQDMPALVRRQEIGAEFVQLAGALFRRDQIKVIDSAPTCMRWVRCWDLAFTQKTTSDFTVGAKLGVTEDGMVIVADVVRGRWEWPEAVRMIATTARQDGQGVVQCVESVGAQVGAVQTLLRDPTLLHIGFSNVEVHNDKVTRALPVIARCEQGRLALVNANWNSDFLDEVSSFPESDYDDQVDALSGGFTELAGGEQVMLA